MRIWAVANQKGGVGKSTTAIALADLLAARGARVLLLDLDPHGSLTSYFGYDADQLPASAFNLFSPAAQNGPGSAENIDKPTLKGILLHPAERIAVIPSSPALATVERRALGQDGMGLRVARALAQLWDDYDYTIIDTPPVLGALMINALAACERLIIPVQTEHLAIKGLERMLRTLTMVGRSLGKQLPYVIVPTMFDRRTQASITSLRHLRKTYPEQIWAGMVPVDTRFRDASRAGQLPSVFDPQARGVQAYAALLKQLLSDQEQRLRA